MLSCNREVVRELHLRILRIFAQVSREESYERLRLDGGTALAAYYLGHRESEDLDLFGDLGLNALAFGEAARELGLREGLRFESVRSVSRSFAGYQVRDEHSGETVRIDLVAASPFLLEPLQPTEEGIPVASFRDLAAGKLHALCDRYAERDFLDLHAIVTRPEPGLKITDVVLRQRFRALARDVMEIDPGLWPHLIGEGIVKGMGRPIVENFTLRLLHPISEDAIQRTLGICFEEAARLTAQGYGR